MKGEHEFLVNVLLDRPTHNMEPQRRLLREWEEEIARLEESLQYLRREYTRYKEQQQKTLALNKKAKAYK